VRFEGILDTDTFILFMQGDRGPSITFESMIERAVRKGTVFLVPFLTILELVYLLEKIYGLPRGEIREKVESIFTLPVEVEEKDLIFEALDIYTKTKLSFGDALMVAKARIKGAQPLYTFSRRLGGIKEVEVLEGSEA